MLQAKKYNLYVLCFLLTYMLVGVKPSFADNMQLTKYEFPGMAFKVCNIAFFDFSKKIESYSNDDSELETFMSHIENYNIKFESMSSLYLVTFLPKTFKGGSIKGGGAYYEIDKSTLIIAKKLYYK